MSDRGRQKVQQLAFSKLYGRDEVPTWDVKRWRGCIFSPRSLLPVPGRGKEADSAATTNGSFPIPLCRMIILYYNPLFSFFLHPPNL